MTRGPEISRRAALKRVGGAGALAALGSTAAAGRDGPIRVTVGYESAAAARTARNLAAELVYEYGFDALALRLDAAGIDALRRREDVRYVERDGVYRAAEQRTPWGVDRVDADVAHERGETAEGAHLAVVDTGIDRNHPDLAANLGQGVAFQGGVQHGSWQDDNGHGTHVAGIAGAVDDAHGVVGVAPRVTLHAVKVLASPGYGLNSDVAKGIEWVADQGYDVANLSLRGDHLSAVAEACEYAAKRGVTLVAAAGNGEDCTDCVTYPAAYPEVVAVSSTTADDALADHSSQGPEVEITAPGEDIYSTTLGGYATKSGTSMACPHVAGAAADLAAGGRSREAIRDRLAATAEDVGLSANEGGAGLLDVAAAVGAESGEASGSASSDAATPEPEQESDAGTATPEATETDGRSESRDETPTATDVTPADGAPGDAPAETPARTGTATPAATDAPPQTASVGTRTPELTAAETGTRTEPSQTHTSAGDSGGLGSVLDDIVDVIRSVLEGLT